MAANAQGAKVYNQSLDYFVQMFRVIETGGISMSLRSETPMPYGVQFVLHHGVSFTSWGETITVSLSDQGGATNVSIYSECSLPTQIIDMGKNRQNVDTIFSYLERGMGVIPTPGAYNNQFTPPQTAYGAAPQSFQAGPQSGVKYCKYCGAQASSDARFCTSCGKQFD